MKRREKNTKRIKIEVEKKECEREEKHRKSYTRPKLGTIYIHAHSIDTKEPKTKGQQSSFSFILIFYVKRVVATRCCRFVMAGKCDPFTKRHASSVLNFHCDS